MPGFTSSDESAWPGDFARIPDEEWTRQPVDQFGLNYDDVGSHGWYKNLEPTIAQVLAALEPGDLLVDYSSGTGILTRRLLERINYLVGILNVDASPKFLRVALESFRDDDRVAFRLLRWLKAEKTPAGAGRSRRAGIARPRSRRHNIHQRHPSLL
jgi:SAM-dependent methyltransferase